MSQFFRLSLKITSIILLCSNSFAEIKVSFVDVNFIFDSSIAGKSVNKTINSKLKEIQNELSNYDKIIREEEKKIINQKNVLSEAEFEKKKNSLEKKLEEFNQKISKKRENLNIYKVNIQRAFLKNLNIILQKYAAENSIDVILKKENILIGKVEFDVTKQIIKLFDQNVKEIKIN